MTNVDLTQIILALIGAVFTVLGTVATALINARMKDAQNAKTMDAAIGHALGAMQQAISNQVHTAHPEISIAHLSPVMQVGVQYAIDHAGEEFARAGITPDLIADKITARLGVVNIQSNLATAASPAPSPPPLAPIPAATSVKGPPP